MYLPARAGSGHIQDASRQRTNTHVRAPEEHRMLQELVAKFVDRDLIPLEKAALAREMAGEPSGLTRRRGEGPRHLQGTRSVGPGCAGGIWRRQPALSALAALMRNRGAPAAIHLPARQPEPAHLIAVANEEQKQKYLEPMPAVRRTPPSRSRSPARAAIRRG